MQVLRKKLWGMEGMQIQMEEVLMYNKYYLILKTYSSIIDNYC